MEERRVRRVREQQRGGEERRNSSERQRDRAPAEDRGRVEEREHDLEQPDASEVERETDDDRRQRRAEDLELGERRIGVEELEVVGEVVPRVATLGHGPAERLDPVDDEREREQHERGAPRRHEGEEPRCHARRHATPREPRRGVRSRSLDARRSRRARGRGPTPGARRTRPRSAASSTYGSDRTPATARACAGVAEAQRGEAIPKPGVDGELAALDPALERGVVDDERRVELVQPCPRGTRGTHPPCGPGCPSRRSARARRTA